MPDTKIRREAQGWIDTDDPNTFYRVRREARAARRAKKQPKQQGSIVYTKTAFSSGTVLKKAPTPADPNALTSLQDRLLVRLTKQQGVPNDDALEIIKNNGYNKAASYGHMRAAGATHAEAKIVIALSQPEVSLAYGKARARGLNHTDALREALQDGSNNNSYSAYSN